MQRDTVNPWSFQSFWSPTTPNGAPGCRVTTPNQKESGSSSPRRVRRNQRRSPTTMHSTKRSALGGSTGNSVVATTRHFGDGSHLATPAAPGRKGTSPSRSGCLPPGACIEQAKTKCRRQKRMADGRPPMPDRPRLRFPRILKEGPDRQSAGRGDVRHPYECESLCRSLSGRKCKEARDQGPTHCAVRGDAGSRRNHSSAGPSIFRLIGLAHSRR